MTTTLMQRADVPAAALALSRALLDDPGWVHVFPDATRRQDKLERLFRLVGRVVYARTQESWLIGDDGVAGAALWDPPGKHDVGVLTTMRLFPRLAWLIGRRTRVALGMFGAMERHHPKEPHYYLAVLGIDPAHQGRGLGPRLLAPVLDRADQARVLSWLESTNPKNHSFYLRVGFEVADQHVVDGGPTITFFARRPR